MEERTSTEKRIAVVTGGNKGIGFEICKQLAENDISVVLTARDVKRGLAAVEKLKNRGMFDVIFHPLDVTDSSSIAALADFIRAKFGKLHILVNNAAVGGIILDPKFTYNEKYGDALEWLITNADQTYELAEECFKTNYYGMKEVTNALLPLLKSSCSGRVVNVSSLVAQTKNLSSERLKQAIHNMNEFAEENLDEIIRSFLDDYSKGLLGANGWPTKIAAYVVTKVLLNIYTIILAKKHPDLCINPVNPGFVPTDMTYNLGEISASEGAKGPVMVALKTENSSSGLLFDITEVSAF